MAKITKTVVDKELRDRIFGWICQDEDTFIKVNDRQYGCILTDLNGVERYVRIGAIVAEEREDMTAKELMQSEIDAYQAKQDAKAEKIAKDKARRAKAKEEEEEKDDENQFLPREVTV